MLWGTNWGQKITVQKKKRANIRFVPRCFLLLFFLSLEKVLFSLCYSKRNANIQKFSLVFVYLSKF